ncbi:MAG: glycosyltransferase [Ilumatobacteraceae bacterium]
MNHDHETVVRHWDAGEIPPRTTVRLAILLNVALAIWYFQWLLDLDRASAVPLFVALIVAEVFNLFQGATFWWTVWSDRRHGRAPALRGSRPSVDILIPVYNEPADVVGPTVAAAARLRGADIHVYLLDDGDSDVMAALARRHGVGYIRRAVHSGAKAGNINHALTQITSDFVAVFDCDHVPDEEFLEATMGHFATPTVAFVQTPQFYGNTADSPIAAASAAQQELFFGVIARGKASNGAMFCCGTNVVFRRTALDDVGGFPEDSLTEDFALSVQLHERGWRSEYVSEVLAVGLGPEDMASYVSQQRRWAQGCLSGIPTVLRSQLPFRTRLQYLVSATYFLSGWTVMLYMLLPMTRLLFGWQPLGMVDTNDFILHFAPYFVASLATVSVASGGVFGFSSFALSSATFGVQIRSLGRVLFRRTGGFVVTPKHGASGRQFRPVGLTIVFIVGLSLAIVVGLVRDPSPSTFNNVAYAGLHLVVLCCGAGPALVGRAERRPALHLVDSGTVAA